MRRRGRPTGDGGLVAALRSVGSRRGRALNGSIESLQVAERPAVLHRQCAGPAEPVDIAFGRTDPLESAWSAQLALAGPVDGSFQVRYNTGLTMAKLAVQDFRQSGREAMSHAVLHWERRRLVARDGGFDELRRHQLDTVALGRHAHSHAPVEMVCPASMRWQAQACREL